MIDTSAPTIVRRICLTAAAALALLLTHAAGATPPSGPIVPTPQPVAGQPICVSTAPTPPPTVTQRPAATRTRAQPAPMSTRRRIVGTAIVVLALGVAVAGIISLAAEFGQGLSRRRSALVPAFANDAKQVSADPAILPPQHNRPRNGDALERTLTERDTLAQTCIDVADRMGDNPALLSRIRHGLSHAGYDVIDPSGHRFDREQHEGIQVTPTSNPDLDMIVAATARVGYRRADQLIRQPEVAVYRYTTPESTGIQ